MEWILKNLELILWIAGPIAVWINQRARQKRGQAADYDEDGIPEIAPSLAPPADDVAREARARRIQRELMRQLQQNQSQTPSPPPPPTPAGYRLASPASPSEIPTARQKKTLRQPPKTRSLHSAHQPAPAAVSIAPDGQSKTHQPPTRIAEPRSHSESYRPPRNPRPTRRPAQRYALVRISVKNTRFPGPWTSNPDQTTDRRPASLADVRPQGTRRTRVK